MMKGFKFLAVNILSAMSLLGSSPLAQATTQEEELQHALVKALGSAEAKQSGLKNPTGLFYFDKQKPRPGYTSLLILAGQDKVYNCALIGTKQYVIWWVTLSKEGKAGGWPLSGGSLSAYLRFHHQQPYKLHHVKESVEMQPNILNQLDQLDKMLIFKVGKGLQLKYQEAWSPQGKVER
jgi:hypothetical protein